MSTAHDEAFAFGLLDDAIDALSAIAHGSDTDQNTVPVDAVLIVRVQRDDDDSRRSGHVAIYPRAGAQPASTRALISEAGTLIDQATADCDAVRPAAGTPGRVTPYPHPKAPPMAYAVPPLVSPQQKTTERITKLTDKDDLRAAARELFAGVGERPPGPRHELTLADVEDYSRRWAQNREAGRFTTTDADIVVDADGRPLAVSRSVHLFRFNWLAIDQAHADRLGIAAAIAAGDYPGVRIFDPYDTKGNDR
ncbi:DUF7213 family protein [Mycobacterium sp. 4D054]|uniref:DUF7213 family protein n=1 Tax=Mycobacterium sp. 4D054 TaxID=3457440 RepID=UPI003FD150DD